MSGLIQARSVFTRGTRTIQQIVGGQYSNSIRQISTSKTRFGISNRNENCNLKRYVDAYRADGHVAAQLDPLGRWTRQQPQTLDPSLYGVANETYDVSDIVSLPSGQSTATLDEITSHLKRTYSRHIGADFYHIPHTEEKEWLSNALESVNVESYFTPGEKKNIYNLLVQSEVFDHFMTVKFGSFKRYGLEGNESMMPAMESLLHIASKQGVEEIVIGMPHRGRLNFLVSLLDYPARALFAKVKGQSLIPDGMDAFDDVASHIAQSVTKKFDPTSSRTVHVSLLHNPSHLEAVNPVSQGKTKAKQDIIGQGQGTAAFDKVLNIQLHGDAAFAGQGIVTEALMLQSLPDFTIGGTVHIIVNNQLGFTTNPNKGRSTMYSSDVARMIHCPVLHVNADDPESVVLTTRIAMAYREKFKKDIIIDLIGYRKWGHNEVDEPSFTQPLMYNNIRSRKSVVKMYGERLMAEGLVTAESTQKFVAKLNSYLENELQNATGYKASTNEHFQGLWKGIGQTVTTDDLTQTGVDVNTLKDIGIASVTVPSDFTVHARLKKGHIDARMKAINENKGIDWATGEALAFGSLLHQGYNIRLTGQDVERGTFSQRHGVLVDQKTEQRYAPLNNAGLKGWMQSVNSHLSELAVLGYEFGYSWNSPSVLNLWEAQFGDFNNGAQIIIDTFITSTESKWLRQTGLVMLLPHGYDGAGPEHSSSRMERFLQLSDDNEFSTKPTSVNVLIVNPTTPAQYFHLLRRQLVRSYRKPLIVVAPKTLLRLPEATSTLNDMAPGTHFKPVLDDYVSVDGVKTVVLCSGKVYYELDAKRKQQNRTDIAFIRIEELSPFPHAALRSTLNKYVPNMKSLVWFQEEPSNAGAWNYVQPRLHTLLNEMKVSHNVKYVGRPALPSPAVGTGVHHKAQVEQIFKDVFAA